jgi:uncharacterized phage infection (PIP) family protein YhgE
MPNATITAPPAATPAPAATTPPPQPEKAAEAIDLYGVSSEIDGLDNPSIQAPAAGKGTPKQPERPEEQQQPKAKTEAEEIQDLDTEEAEEKLERTKRQAEKEKLQAEENEELEGEKPNQEEPTPTRAKDLKRVYEETKAAKKQLESKLSEATKRIEELQRSNPDEVKAVAEKLAKAEARRDELEQKMRYMDYRESREFKEKYEAPITEAWNRAILDLNETVVTLEDGTTRKASVDDLVQIGNMPLQQAAKVAREMFGDAAEDILAHRRTIRELTIQQDKALTKAKQEALERRKTEEVENRQRAEKYQTVWKQESEALAAKYPKWMKPVEGDEEGNKILNSGYEDVDRFFNDSSLAPEERVKLHAKIRMRAANHDRMALRLKRMAGKLQELKTKLSEYESSAPPTGKTTPRMGRASTGMDDALSEIESLNNPNLD